jgi:hypothetical protein
LTPGGVEDLATTSKDAAVGAITRMLRKRFPWRSATIPVYVGARYGLWWDDAGHPIWPVASVEEMRSLKVACSYYSGAAEEISKTRRLLDPNGYIKRGLVVSLDRPSKRPGSLYAHLTGRDHRHLSTVSIATLAPDTEVVVATPESITYDLLELLYDPKLFRVAPGLILGNSEEDLRQAALFRSAVTSLVPVALTSLQRFDAFNSLPSTLFERVKATGCSDTGKADLAILEADSDGIDVNLQGRVLCPLLPERDLLFARHPGSIRRGGGTSPIPPQRSVVGGNPLCIDTKYCHRLRVSVPEALNSDLLLSPTNVSARALLLKLCFGFLPRNAIYDNKFGFARYIYSNRNLAFILTSWETLLVAAGDTEPLVDILKSGGIIGSGVRDFNRSKIASLTGARLCIIGDPRFRFRRNVVESRRRQIVRSTAVETRYARLNRRRNNSDVASQAEFLISYLTVAAQGASVQHSALFQNTLGLVRKRLQSEENPGFSSDEGTALMRTMSLGGTMPSKVWMAFASPYSAKRKAVHCGYCGLLSTCVKFELQLVSQLRRRITICPRCGITEDVEVGSPQITITRADSKVVTFQPGPRHRPWQAYMKLEEVGCAEGIEVVGEVVSNCIAEHELEVPPNVSNSTRSVGLFILDGTRFSAARFPWEPGRSLKRSNVRNLQ